MANPYDFVSVLLTGLQTTLVTATSGLTLAGSPLLTKSVIYGDVDPQSAKTVLPAVVFRNISTVPATTPSIQTDETWVVNPDNKTATTSTEIKRYLTMVEVDVWTTNPSDRSLVSAAIHVAIDHPNQILLPDSTTALCRLQKELWPKPQLAEHLYRANLTYICEHRLMQVTVDYLVLQFRLTLEVNGVPA